MCSLVANGLGQSTRIAVSSAASIWQCDPPPNLDSNQLRTRKERPVIVRGTPEGSPGEPARESGKFAGFETNQSCWPLSGQASLSERILRLKFLDWGVFDLFRGVFSVNHCEHLLFPTRDIRTVRDFDKSASVTDFFDRKALGAFFVWAPLYPRRRFANRNQVRCHGGFDCVRCHRGAVLPTFSHVIHWGPAWLALESSQKKIFVFRASKWGFWFPYLCSSSLHVVTLRYFLLGCNVLKTDTERFFPSSVSVFQAFSSIKTFYNAA